MKWLVYCQGENLRKRRKSLKISSSTNLLKILIFWKTVGFFDQIWFSWSMISKNPCLISSNTFITRANISSNFEKRFIKITWKVLENVSTSLKLSEARWTFLIKSPYVHRKLADCRKSHQPKELCRETDSFFLKEKAFRVQH